MALNPSIMADFLTVVLLLAVFLGSTFRNSTFLNTKKVRRPATANRATTAGLLGLLLAVAGWIMLGPLDNLARTNAAWHMTQHMALMVGVAPLWVLLTCFYIPSQHAAVGQQGTHRPTRFNYLMVRPMLSAYVHAVVIWFWHIPWFYVLALQNPWIHVLEQWSFLLSAVWFWSACLWPVRPSARGRESTAPDGAMHGRQAGYALLGLLLTLMHTGFLGALLTFAASSLYGDGRSMGSQQLAGLLMWVLGAVPYIAAASWITISWYKRLRDSW